MGVSGKINLHNSNSGFAAIAVLLFFLILIGAIIGIDFGYIAYSEKCGDYGFKECFFPVTPTPVSPDNSIGSVEITVTPFQKNTVTAKGKLSYQDYETDVTLSIPLEGGAVKGIFEGDCSGNITGVFEGGEGELSGKAFGKCDPFIIPVPANAVFSGKVQQSNKTVPLSGTGGIPGFTGKGMLTLTY